MSKSNKNKTNPADEMYAAGWTILAERMLFRFMRVNVSRHKGNRCPGDGWVTVTRNGVIHAHPTRRGEPEEWAYVLAHAMLHLALEHFKPQPDHDTFMLWNIACDVYVARFLHQLKIGRPPREYDVDVSSLPAGSEEAIFKQILEGSFPEDWKYCGTTGPDGPDMIWEDWTGYNNKWTPTWDKDFAQGIESAVTKAVAKTSNRELDWSGNVYAENRAEAARNWFVGSYPLLGAIATRFKIIFDTTICQRMQITVAAISSDLQEIYLNPAAGLNDEEMRFVMAHEFLHAGLRHDVRAQGRDPYLWNVACDYVINDWLLEMGIGQVPRVGLLHDPELRNMSAEEIYDLIANDLRKYRKLWTLRGKGLGDILPPNQPGWWLTGVGVSLDEFYRGALAQGLEYHVDQGRGFLPAGLVEEIQALSQPPIPWDVKLAQWFDLHFPALEKRRTFARPSRRQGATPDIPRPRWIVPIEQTEGRTFGVVLDTSGSMPRSLLAKALGAIASYALVRDVPLARVVFCDATYYDQGYMAPEDIAGRVQVRGRGGTILQPALDFLERAEDFPDDGPILIITDGECDRLQIKGERPHAYLLPAGARLPFQPRGERFYIA